MLYIWITRYFVRVNFSLNLREKDFYLNVDRNFLFPTRKIRRVYIYIYNCTDKALSLKVFYVVGNFTRILSKRKIDDCTISLRFVALPVKCVEIPRQQGDLLIRLLLASYTKTFTGRGIRKSWWRISSRFLATIVKIITRQDRLDNFFRKEMEIWASAHGHRFCVATCSPWMDGQMGTGQHLRHDAASPPVLENRWISARPCATCNRIIIYAALVSCFFTVLRSLFINVIGSPRFVGHRLTRR